VTIRKRMLAKNRQNKTELRKRMHDPVAQTGLWLKRSSQVTSTTQQYQETPLACPCSGTRCSYTTATTAPQ
jgi:hypothetical protein